MIASPVIANAQRYTVTPLVMIDSTPNVQILGTAGINNKGQVVYTWKDSNNVYHAWVWLPEYDAAYDLDAGVTFWSDTSDPPATHMIASHRCRRKSSNQFWTTLNLTAKALPSGVAFAW